MNVLSLFDGMSCGQLALNRAGIKYDKYFASEIDKHAIKVTQANFPNTIQLGDVTKVFAKDLPKIDLIIGGSPCQGFSFAGKGLNFDDPRSKLFFEFVRLVKECNPRYFLLENVKMKKEHELVISRYLGVAPIVINSSLVSAQNRVRLYWTNINEKEYGLFGDKFSDIPQPKDKGILLKDILECEVDEKYFLNGDTLRRLLDEKPKINPEKSYSVNTHNNTAAGSHSRTMTMIEVVTMRGRGKNNEQQLEENHSGKTNSLTSVTKDNLLIQRGRGFNKGGSHKNKSTPITSNSWEHNHSINNIRRLTPIECERLQTVPDNYTNHVSDSQRYKMLGNGWTIDVIAHILNFINVEKFNLIQNN